MPPNQRKYDAIALGVYPTKVQVSDEAMAALQLTPHAFHGEWNYTIAPAPLPT
jgi:hypothetical protein